MLMIDLQAAKTCAVIPALQHICSSAVLSHWQECQGDGRNLFSLQYSCKPIKKVLHKALSNIVEDRLYCFIVKTKQLPILGVPLKIQLLLLLLKKKKNNVSAFNSSYANVRNRILSVYLIVLLPERSFSIR